MREKYFDDSLYFYFDNIENDKIDHLFSSRIGWEDENKEINKIFNCDKEVISLKQIHGDKVYVVDKEFKVKNKGKLLEGDGLLTSLDTVILKTYHADCTPIYFIDYKKRVVGVAHAGWKGTYENIMEKMIDSMMSKFDCSLETINIFIGPCIKDCCYEVGEDIYNKFFEKYKRIGAFDIRNESYYLNIGEINLYQAETMGIKKSNIFKSNLCTGCNTDKLYSYRKENKTQGRLVAAISIKK